jgi:hypothetical protein
LKRESVRLYNVGWCNLLDAANLVPELPPATEKIHLVVNVAIVIVKRASNYIERTCRRFRSKNEELEIVGIQIGFFDLPKDL